MKVLRRAFYVRKRWDGENVYLVWITKIMKIDVFTEAIWDFLSVGRAWDDVSPFMARTFPEIEANLREALIARNVIVLQQQGFIEGASGTGS